MLRSHHKQQGFSLLEILVAFSILAFSLGIVLKIFSTGLHTAQVTGDYTTAVQIAQNLLNQTGSELPLKVAEFDGSEAGIYHWHLSVAPKQFTSPELDWQTLPVALFDVTVRVWWGENPHAAARVVELNTLKLAVKDE